MQRNEGLVRGEPWPDVLGPNRISTSFSVVLPIFFNPTSAGPSLQMRGQPGLPGRPFLLYLGSCVLLKHPSHLWHKPTPQTGTCLHMGFREWILMCVFSCAEGDAEKEWRQWMILMLVEYISWVSVSLLTLGCLLGNMHIGIWKISLHCKKIFIVR